MNLFAGNRGVALAIAFVMLAGAAAAWRMQTRAENRAAQETKSRIERDVKNSIGEATKNIKLCPLADPDCGRR
jgi:hypothetical protein